MGQRRLERAIQRRRADETRRPEEDDDKDESEGEKRMMMETEGTKEEAVEILQEALGMEVEEGCKGEEGGDGTLRELDPYSS